MTFRVPSRVPFTKPSLAHEKKTSDFPYPAMFELPSMFCHVLSQMAFSDHYQKISNIFPIFPSFHKRHAHGFTWFHHAIDQKKHQLRNWKKKHICVLFTQMILVITILLSHHTNLRFQIIPMFFHDNPSSWSISSSLGALAPGRSWPRTAFRYFSKGLRSGDWAPGKKTWRRPACAEVLDGWGTMNISRTWKWGYVTFTRTNGWNLPIKLGFRHG